MTIRQPSRSIIDAVELPRIIQLGENLYGATFFLMKLLPARFILARAREAGLLKPGSVVIETSSGSFGLALAMECHREGYRLILVGDPTLEPPLRRRMEDLGAQVELVREPEPVGGYQGARLRRTAELREAHPGHFWPSQYHNPHNAGAYAPFAELVAETVGYVDCLVGAVGSGGAMSGSTRYLRQLFPDLHSVAVDTLGSVLFGQPDEATRRLPGLGNSLMPGNLNHSAFDEVHWVSAAEAFLATRRLHQKHALYMGPTSGAAYLAASWWAGRHPDSNVVVLLPDEGYRYQDTVYNDEWLKARDALLTEQPEAPRQVSHPREAGPGWSFMHWNRRTYEQVLGRPFPPEPPPTLR